MESLVTPFFHSVSPIGTNWVLDLIGTYLGLGQRGFGTKSLGQGLDNNFVPWAPPTISLVPDEVSFLFPFSLITEIQWE